MLPGSGLALRVGEPTSDDELFVLETSLAPPLAILELGRRVVRGARGEQLDWDALPATDLGAVALTIRRQWLGDVLTARGECPAAACGQPIDIGFSVGAYIAHHRPRPARGTVAAGEPGWYQLRGGTGVRFRAARVADLLEVRDAERPLTALTERCVAGGRLSAGQARRVDRALAALSPPLDDVVGGTCPGCGQAVELRFEPCGFVLAELCDEFAALYLETHLLAASYGWEEAAILRLPRSRRRRYAGLAAQERAAA